jgi:nucleoside-diphosphate-sugar epimerase
MNILVIGGTRFIGAAVVRRLAEMGHVLAIVNRGLTPWTPMDRVGRLFGDMNNLAEYDRDIFRFSPEIVLHNMPLHEKHITDLQDVTRGIARRLIMTSSMDVYQMFGRLNGTEPGPVLPVPADEDAPLRESRFPHRRHTPGPEHPLYDYDKIPAEQAALSDPELPGTVLRLPMVIGPKDYQHRLFPFVRPMQDGRPAIVMDEAFAHWRSTYGYIDNVAQAMVQACLDDRATGRIYNIGEQPASILDLAQQVKTVMDWPGELILAPAEKLPDALHADMNTEQDLVCSMTRIQTELDFVPPVPFEEGVRRTVEWQIDNPPDPIPDHVLNYAAQDEALRNLRGG